MGGGGGWREGLKPVAGMVVVQMVFAGVNIFYKFAVNDGMDMRVLVAYRYVFATAFLAPLVFVERKYRPKMTWKVLVLAFSCGLFGGSLSQNLYLSSIRLTSPTFAAAMGNLIPAITFILAVALRLEALKIGSVSGQAKVLGTLAGVGGAMILTFYKGVEINIWHRDLHLFRPHHTSAAGSTSTHQDSVNRVAGSVFGTLSCLSYAIWLIVQAKMYAAYPAHYTGAALMCVMSAAQSVLCAICLERDWGMWRLGFDIRLFTVLYVGIVATGVSLVVMNWCIAKKGPLFASTFNPLMLVIVAPLSTLLLNEKLHLGSILGAALIVVGLYLVIWGKKREAAKVSEMPQDQESMKLTIDSGHKEPQEIENSKPVADSTDDQLQV